MAGPQLLPPKMQSHMCFGYVVFSFYAIARCKGAATYQGCYKKHFCWLMVPLWCILGCTKPRHQYTFTNIYILLQSLASTSGGAQRTCQNFCEVGLAGESYLTKASGCSSNLISQQTRVCTKNTFGEWYLETVQPATKQKGYMSIVDSYYRPKPWQNMWKTPSASDSLNLW